MIYLTRISLVAVLIGATLSPNSIAAGSERKKTPETTLQQHSEEFKPKAVSEGAISNDGVTRKSHELTKEESLYRIEAITVESKTALDTSKLESLKLTDELQKKEFLLSKVPTEVRIGGDKAVKAYVDDYLNKKRLAEQPVEKKNSETIWTSSQTSLSAVTSPLSNVPAVQTAQTNVNIPTQPLKAVENSDALAALGLTQEQFDELKKNSSSKKGSDADKKTKKSEKISHSLKDIRWNRVVVMGKVKRADLTVDIKVEGSETPLEHTINNLEPGSTFKIAQTEYHVDDISEQAVVVTEVKSKKSHRVTVR